MDNWTPARTKFSHLQQARFSWDATVREAASRYVMEKHQSSALDTMDGTHQVFSNYYKLFFRQFTKQYTLKLYRESGKKTMAMLLVFARQYQNHDDQ